MATMTDSNSTNNPFSLPRTLEIQTSDSTCSLDVSVLSMDSSCPSFGSMSQAQERRPSKKAHKRRSSVAKFGRARWNNTVDAFGSAGMNTAPFRKPSYNRLSNPKLHRMSLDVPANVPCRKCSHTNLALHMQGRDKGASADGPACQPTRQESNDSVSDHSGNRATAALNSHLRNSLKSKNFQWKFNTTKSQLNARTNPPMRESVFSSNPPSPGHSHNHNRHKKKNPPSIPARRGSMMEFNILNNFDQVECTCGGASSSSCSDARYQPSFDLPQPAAPSAMMPPPIPARKESLMDFDDLSSQGSSQILPPAMNSTWSPGAFGARRSAVRPLGMMACTSDPSNGLGASSDHTRHSNVLLAMPPMTKFERQASTTSRTVTSRTTAASPPRMPGRRSSTSPPPSLMAMPPSFGRQTSSMSAPAVPQRKQSLMDINDFDL